MSYNNSNSYSITIPGIYNMFDNSMKKIGYLVSDPIQNDEYFSSSVNRAYFSITRFISVVNQRLNKKDDLSHSERNDFKSMINRMIKLKIFFEQYFDKFIKKIDTNILLAKSKKL
jgi:hypothetical protein